MIKIRENIIKENIYKILKQNKMIWVLKDNAYGFGISRMIKIAKEVGVSFFAVKNMEEAKRIRSLYDTADILLLGKCRKENIPMLRQWRIIPTINDYDDYIIFKENQIPAHLAVDVGMNRFGMKNGYLAVINDSIVKAVYTHLYEMKDQSLKIMLIEDLARKYHKTLHIGGSMAYQHTKAMLRVGRLIYEHVLYFYGHIVNIKKVQKGESVGYDGAFKPIEDCLIGVCDIGYSDGLYLYYHGDVCIHKNRYSCVGRCCMDQCFILIDEKVFIGDEVEFFGKEIDEDEFILHNQMTKYELFLAMNQQKI